MKIIQTFLLLNIMCFSVTNLFACSTSYIENKDVNQTCEKG